MHRSHAMSYSSLFSKTKNCSWCNPFGFSLHRYNITDNIVDSLREMKGGWWCSCRVFVHYPFIPVPSFAKMVVSCFALRIYFSLILSRSLTWSACYIRARNITIEQLKSSCLAPTIAISHISITESTVFPSCSSRYLGSLSLDSPSLHNYLLWLTFRGKKISQNPAPTVVFPGRMVCKLNRTSEIIIMFFVFDLPCTFAHDHGDLAHCAFVYMK